MAYVDVTSLHALPTNQSRPAPPPAAILFPRGPQWQWRYQRNQAQDKLRDRFMYQDAGPPMYRLLGHHYNMYATPNRTDTSTFSKSLYYEPRQYNEPRYRANCVAFPAGPPPVQVADLEAAKSRKTLANGSVPEFPGRSLKSYKQWDKYRLLPGPPPEVDLFYK